MRVGVLVVALLAYAAPAQAMTIDQAYAAIPHQRPLFNAALTSMAPDEAAYLHQLFALIDLAVKERVETLAWLRGHAGDGTDEYDGLLHRLGSLQAPARLLQVHQLVTRAIEEQRDVLREWRQAPGSVDLGHPLVHSASQKLYQAYGGVMQLYPQEHSRNRQAFYDYFCCLDFL